MTARQEGPPPPVPGPEQVARGARTLVARLRADMEFLCAVREPFSDDLYLGTDRGAVVATAGGAVHHVKLKGEAMHAAVMDGQAGVWMAGAESLVRLEAGKSRTDKHARRDFGIAAGPIAALHWFEGALWIGLRVRRSESPLYRVDPAARRVQTFPFGQRVLAGGVRAITRYQGELVVLADSALCWPGADGRFRRVEELGGATRESAPTREGFLETARRLVDAGFLFPAHAELMGRDLHGVFSLASGAPAVMAPLPAEISALGTCAFKMADGAWLVGTPLGLLRWDGQQVTRLGTEPVVALLPGNRPGAGRGAINVVTPYLVVEVEPAALRDGPAFLPDVEGDLSHLARIAFERGGPRARCTALRTLTHGDFDPLVVIRALADPAPEVKVLACELAADRKVVAARPLLDVLASDPDRTVSGRAMQALVALGDESAPARVVECLRRLPVDDARRMIRDLAGRGQAAIEVLRPFVLDDRPIVRRSAILMLGKLGFPRPMLGAIAQIECPGHADRVKGVANLARLDDPLVTYLLSMLLRDPDWPVRRAVVIALGQVTARSALPEDVAPVVAPDILKILERHPEDGELVASGVRLSQVLGDALPAEMVERGLAHPVAEVRRAAVEAAERQRRRDLVPALIETLGDQDLEVRGAAVDALGRIGDPRALRHLQALLEEPVTFRVAMAGEAGHRAVSRAMARIVALEVPVQVELDDPGAWNTWYRERLVPLLARFGLARSSA